MYRLLFLSLFCFSLIAFNSHSLSAQEEEPKTENKDNSEKKPKTVVQSKSAGNFSLGLRTTFSTFSNNSWSNTGLGSGAQFRLQFSPRINSEWFFDYLNSDIAGKANRTDYHIGWSVMFYPFPGNLDFEKTLRPYVQAGHCFDLTQVRENANPLGNNARRWSSAIQAGLGTHINFDPRFDCSISAQYMMHLGNDLHADINGDTVIIEQHDGAGLEGHLLFTLSINYKIVDLW